MDFKLLIPGAIGLWLFYVLVTNGFVIAATGKAGVWKFLQGITLFLVATGLFLIPVLDWFYVDRIRSGVQNSRMAASIASDLGQNPESLGLTGHGQAIIPEMDEIRGVFSGGSSQVSGSVPGTTSGQSATVVDGSTVAQTVTTVEEVSSQVESFARVDGVTVVPPLNLYNYYTGEQIGVSNDVTVSICGYGIDASGQWTWALGCEGESYNAVAVRISDITSGDLPAKPAGVIPEIQVVAETLPVEPVYNFDNAGVGECIIQEMTSNGISNATQFGLGWIPKGSGAWNLAAPNGFVSAFVGEVSEVWTLKSLKYPDQPPIEINGDLARQMGGKARNEVSVFGNGPLYEACVVKATQ